MLYFLGPQAWGILAPWPGIEPQTPALEDEVSTIGPPGKSLDVPVFIQPIAMNETNQRLYKEQGKWRTYEIFG